MKRIRLLILLALSTPVHAADTLETLESEARNLLAQGKSLNRATGARGACGQKMRTLQPQVRQLQARIDALPNPQGDKIYLGLAANHLLLCVSCNMRLGPEQCNEAATYLDKMKSRR